MRKGKGAESKWPWCWVFVSSQHKVPARELGPCPNHSQPKAALCMQKGSTLQLFSDPGSWRASTPGDGEGNWAAAPTGCQTTAG